MLCSERPKSFLKGPCLVLMEIHSAQGPMEAVHRAALALGTANQLTNILRDVGEDAVERNRIYLPREELDQFGISESEVSNSLLASPTL